MGNGGLSRAGRTLIETEQQTTQTMACEQDGCNHLLSPFTGLTQVLGSPLLLFDQKASHRPGC